MCLYISGFASFLYLQHLAIVAHLLALVGHYTFNIGAYIDCYMTLYVCDMHYE